MRRWSLDIMSDQLASGRRFRILNILDDCSRERPGQIVDLSISGRRPARFLNDLARRCGLPETLVMDNGPELPPGRCSNGPNAPASDLTSLSPAKASTGDAAMNV